MLEAAGEEYAAHSAGKMRRCNATITLQVAPDGQQQAGALIGETNRHLLVYHEGSMGDVTEAEVTKSCACCPALLAGSVLQRPCRGADSTVEAFSKPDHIH